MRAEARFAAMGTRAHVVVNGDAGLLDMARRSIGGLEQRWTRFQPSEISRLNASPGIERRVSPETFTLLERCVAAWRLTRGHFDPTVHDAMIANGYARTYERVTRAPIEHRAAFPAPGLAGVALDPGRQSVTLPPGVRIDAGGIGKGLAADLVSDDLLNAGAEGVLVSIGGDIRVAGVPPGAPRWTIALEDPHSPERDLGSVAIETGAVATSSRLRRTWSDGSTRRHHVLNPFLGRPTTNDVDAVTVVAAAAWWAEALATALMVSGEGPDSSLVRDASVVVVRRDGSHRASPDLEEALR